MCNDYTSQTRLTNNLYFVYTGNVRNPTYMPTNDKIIRSALIHELKEHNRFKEHTRVIPELTLPNESVRVDVAVVNGIMHGYELKSDRDTLERLNSQILAYSAVFDKVTLVVGKKHIIEALGLVPEWWGITIAKSMEALSHAILIPVREASNNPEPNLEAIVNLLWKDEALECLLKIGKANGLKSKPKDTICKALIEHTDPIDLKAIVRDTLINRRFVREKQVALSLS